MIKEMDDGYASSKLANYLYCNVLEVKRCRINKGGDKDDGERNF